MIELFTNERLYFTVDEDLYNERTVCILLFLIHVLSRIEIIFVEYFTFLLFYFILKYYIYLCFLNFIFILKLILEISTEKISM